MPNCRDAFTWHLTATPFNIGDVEAAALASDTYVAEDLKYYYLEHAWKSHFALASAPHSTNQMSIRQRIGFAGNEDEDERGPAHILDEQGKYST